jgi:hypothetical protein
LSDPILTFFETSAARCGHPDRPLAAGLCKVCGAPLRVGHGRPGTPHQISRSPGDLRTFGGSRRFFPSWHRPCNDRSVTLLSHFAYPLICGCLKLGVRGFAARVLRSA